MRSQVIVAVCPGGETVDGEGVLIVTAHGYGKKARIESL